MWANDGWNEHVKGWAAGQVDDGGSLGELMRGLALEAQTNDIAMTSKLQPAICVHTTAHGPRQSRPRKHNATNLLQMGKVGSE